MNSLLIGGLVPGLGGSGKVSIGAIVQDSHANPEVTARLVVSYQVTDIQGQVLQRGSLTDGVQVPHSSFTAFGQTIALAVAPGSTETITISAADVDTVGQPMTSTFHLFVSPKRGISTVGFGATMSNHDTYVGSGIGKMTLKVSPSGAFTAAGCGTVQLQSGPLNDTVVSATGSGRFSFSYDTAGNFNLGITGGKGVLKVGTDAGDPTATGGMSASLAGQLHVTRYATGAINAGARGTIGVVAQWNKNTSTPSSLNARGCNVAIRLTTDGNHGFKLGLAGKMKMSGSLTTSSILG